MSPKVRKIFKYTILLIIGLISLPIILVILIIIIATTFHVGFNYDGGRNTEIATFINSTKPEGRDKYLDFTTWNLDRSFGEVLIYLLTDNEVTISDEDGKPLVRVMPKDPKLKELKNYEATDSSILYPNYVPTSRTKGTYLIAYPNIEYKFINSDGTEKSGPVFENKMHHFFGYKNGKWEFFSISKWHRLGSGKSFKDGNKLFYGTGEYDYIISINMSYSFVFRNYKALGYQPKYYFNQAYYPWKLKFTVDNQTFTTSFVSVKNPLKLVFYPYE